MSSSSPWEDSPPEMHLTQEHRKRVARACEGCRLRKAKCDGLKPCYKCKAANIICTAWKGKKTKERVCAKGYVDALERRQLQLIAGLEDTYHRLVAAHLWPGKELPEVSGQPLVHDILAALDLIPKEGEEASTSHKASRAAPASKADPDAEYYPSPSACSKQSPAGIDTISKKSDVATESPKVHTQQQQEPPSPTLTISSPSLSTSTITSPIKQSRVSPSNTPVHRTSLDRPNSPSHIQKPRKDQSRLSQINRSHIRDSSINSNSAAAQTAPFNVYLPPQVSNTITRTTKNQPQQALSRPLQQLSNIQPSALLQRNDSNESNNNTSSESTAPDSPLYQNHSDFTFSADFFNSTNSTDFSIVNDQISPLMQDNGVEFLALETPNTTSLASGSWWTMGSMYSSNAATAAPGSSEKMNQNILSQKQQQQQRYPPNALQLLEIQPDKLDTETQDMDEELNANMDDALSNMLYKELCDETVLMAVYGQNGTCGTGDWSGSGMAY